MALYSDVKENYLGNYVSFEELPINLQKSRLKQGGADEIALSLAATLKELQRKHHDLIASAAKAGMSLVSLEDKNEALKKELHKVAQERNALDDEVERLQIALDDEISMKKYYIDLNDYWFGKHEELVNRTFWQKIKDLWT